MILRSIFSSITVAVLLCPISPAHADDYQYTQLQCSDLAGQQRDNNSGSSYQNDAGSWNSARNEAHQSSQSDSMRAGGSYGASVLGTGANVGFNYSSSGSSSAANSLGNSDGNAWNNGFGETYNRDTMRTTVIGENCDSYNQAAAQRDAAHMNYELQRRRDSMSLFHNVTGW